MDSFYFFVIIGSVVVFLILQFDKQQRTKVRKTLRQTNDVEPLLMMQSLGQKLDRLNKALSNADANIEQQFHKSTADYKAGRISIDIFNKHLNELLYRVEERQK
ncbi:hypothetical protein [Mucilaginibacter sp.]|uniref:hypothetical protein n=1 Tax=Mucilaginibacter sp. TaxID=1882438 RepID=UPI0025F55AF2|nr:hypothetical protein [Mucilaginibacter sp.]